MPAIEATAGDPVTPEFLDAFAAAWNRHDADAIMAMMTPDCVMCLVAGPGKEGARSEGQAGVKAAVEAVFARVPDVQWRNARHFIAGDRGVTEWTMTGTTADGQRIEANGCDVFTFRDGLIALKDSYRKIAG